PACVGRAALVLDGHIAGKAGAPLVPDGVDHVAGAAGHGVLVRVRRLLLREVGPDAAGHGGAGQSNERSETSETEGGFHERFLCRAPRWMLASRYSRNRAMLGETL